MSMSEFVNNAPSPRRGMTSVEAAAFLQRECPEAGGWACWCPRGGREEEALTRIPAGEREEGSVGPWKWRRIPVSYPGIPYWRDAAGGDDEERWTGLIEVSGESGEKFLLFSYLSTRGTVGELYMTSAAGRETLKRFATDAARHFDRYKDKVKISVWPGPDIRLDPAVSERLFLPAGMGADIERQARSFFEQPEAYGRFGIPYRRGLLFVGPPGNGKTMMVREVVRRCWREYRPAVAAVPATKHADENMLQLAFAEASRRGRGIVILEEVDALVAETDITRAALLDCLDGLAYREGVLVLATTNNPENVDPALMHRPSRFDRVWRFELPGEGLRREFLAHRMPELNGELAGCLARRTEGWSFAYLNELRTTAAILAIQRGAEPCQPALAEEAFDLLQAQFRSGTKNHKCARAADVGFRAA